jgi:peptidoglycan/LPS O-acetylase OafA/YrhL
MPPSGLPPGPPPAPSRGRIPSLDGLRAVAILLVIGVHLGQRYFTLPQARIAGLFVADGVGIFFVLSGFLITTLLLREHETTGRIDLRAFYLRRTLRILPPLYVYLAAVVLLSVVLHLHQQGIAASVFFYRNMVDPPHAALTEHVWSLSLEEQFYLLWPFAFVLALVRGGKRAASRLAAALILAAPVVRVGIWATHLPLFAHRETYFLFARMDALMSGCLLALLVGIPRFERVFAQVSRVWWLLPLYFFLLSGLMNAALGNAWHMTLGLTLDSLTAALFILWCARHPDHLLGRLLNSRPMVTLGVLSYSAYLWQTLFTHAEPQLGFINRAPWSLGMILLAAWISYRVIERPSFALRASIVERLRNCAPAEGRAAS